MRDRVCKNILKEEFEAIYQADPTRPHPQKSRMTDMTNANKIEKALLSFEVNALVFWLNVKYNIGVNDHE